MTSRWGRTASVAALACGAVLGLAGCSGGDEPDETTSTSSSTSPSSSASSSPTATGSTGTPSPSSSAMPVPEAAKARTEDGAIAFLRFFYDEVNRGQTAPGTVDLFAYSDKDCIACKNLQGALQEYVDKGWSVQQAPVRLSDVALATGVTADRVIINFDIQQAPVNYYKDGASIGKLEAFTSKHAAALRWIDGEWVMFDMEEL